MNRRWAVAGLVAACLMVPGLAACGSGDNTPNATASPSGSASSSSATADDAKQKLLDSTKELSNGNFRFAITGGPVNSTGLVHLPSRSAQMKMKIGQAGSDVTMDVDFIWAEPDTWVKVDVGGAAVQGLPGMDKVATGKYLHIDPTKAADLRDLRFDPNKVDPANSAELARAITDVRETGEDTYAGTIDVSKAPDSGMFDVDLVTALGAQANAVPFTARLDSQGRLTEMVIQVPAAGNTKAQEIKITYSDYGAATAAQKPAAAQVVEAPPELYQVFKQPR
ncbi:MAG TPA: hypothetical protein VF462_07790 [Micromonosporaceae bacterium]